MVISYGKNTLQEALLMSHQFCAAGPIFVLPVLRYWLKDTNMDDGLSVTHGVVVDHQVSDKKVPATTADEISKELA